MRAILRLVLLLVGIAQSAMPAVLSVADGLAANGNRNQASHVEAPSANTCQPPHSTECGLCRFLSAFTTVPSVGGACLIGIAQSIADSRPITADAAEFRFGFQSRAPPTA